MEVNRGKKIRDKGEEMNANVKEDGIKISSLIEDLNKATLMIEGITRKKAEGVVSMSREDGILKLLVEVLERKSIPDSQDILSIYEMKLNSNMDIIDYNKIGMRRRSDMFTQDDN
ncbi:hypothetical protein MSBRW_0666 [Methanosarcina barkeri str. Wiesmoor]|uniref:Uncharacterized protein n=2 Tax=Methanosarcina barkeri TaxID=2208 RepID=A0A0E3QIY5_METBA|nr:gas vesicle protein GvpO [Methanosarcina barkeri]AKB49919.1 hypothetical protein MSBRW_0666 [Methanosarcina barkeri str. Wiesmoor]